MKFASFAIAALTVASTARAGPDDQLPPEAYVDPIDQQIAKTGVGLPGRPGACLTEEVTNGIKVIVGKAPERCVKMLPQQRWRGLWRAAFEGSRFCPDPAKTCDGNTSGEQVWLSGTPGRPDGGLYRVDFIGRRTMYRGPYGHFGMFDQELVMDRVISIKLIEAGPLMKRQKCEAPDCIPTSESFHDGRKRPR